MEDPPSAKGRAPDRKSSSTNLIGPALRIQEIPLGMETSSFFDRITSRNYAYIAILVGYSGGSGRYLPAQDGPQSKQCPALIAINNSDTLEALEKVTGVKLPPSPWIMTWPFKVLLGFEKEIRTSLASLKRRKKASNEMEQSDISASEPGTDLSEKSSKNHLDHLYLLVTLISSHLQELFRLRACFTKRMTDSVSFDTLWFLFRPGCTVIPGPEDSSTSCSEQAYRLLYVDYQSGSVTKQTQPRFRLVCVFLAFHMDHLETRSATIDIEWFPGQVRISQLPAFPIEYSDRNDLGSQLLARGDVFLNSFHGASTNLVTTKFYCSKEYVVDFQAAGQDGSALPESAFGNKWGSMPYQLSSSMENPLRQRFWPSEGLSALPLVYDDGFLDRRLGELHGQIRAVRLKTIGDSPELSSMHRRLLPPRLPGFCLETNSWEALDIAGFEKHETRKDGVRQVPDQLVLPKGYHQIIQAAVASRKNVVCVRKGIKDSGAGERETNPGLVILLHGPPGCGMATIVRTAAAISKPRRPVYQITCAELSSNPELFKRDLSTHLDRAERWDCIVLLEDAEVYLSERDENMDRSRIVSTFLHALDNLSGTVFLTTTRVGLLDEAVKPHIHVALSIPAMDRGVALRTWEKALDTVVTLHRSKGVKLRVDQRNITAWAMGRYRKTSVVEKTWSYQQIYNTIETAIVIASAGKDSEADSDIQPSGDEESESSSAGPILLNASHFSLAESFTQGFNSYLEECRGKDEDRAAEFHLRAPADFNSLPVHRPGDSARRPPIRRPYGFYYGEEEDEYTPERYGRPEFLAPDLSSSRVPRRPPTSRRTDPPPRGILKHWGSPPPQKGRGRQVRLSTSDSDDSEEDEVGYDEVYERYINPDIGEDEGAADEQEPEPVSEVNIEDESSSPKEDEDGFPDTGKAQGKPDGDHNSQGAAVEQRSSTVPKVTTEETPDPAI